MIFHYKTPKKCPYIFHIFQGNSHHSSNIVRAALPEHRPLLTCPTAKRYLEQIPGPGPPPFENGGTLGSRFTQFLKNLCLQGVPS